MTLQANFSQTNWQEKFHIALEIQPCDENKENKKSTKKGNFIPCEFLFPWKELNACIFQSELKDRTFLLISSISKILKDDVPELEDLKDACVCYTGSDGRDEKLSKFSSHMELMFLARHVKEINEMLLQKIKIVISKYPELFITDIDVKCIETDSLICFDRNKNWKSGNKDDRPFPTRALDAQFLIGNPDLFKTYKCKFYEEVQNPDSKKKIGSFKNCAIRPAMQLLQRSTIGIAVSDINIQQGSMTYNGDRVKASKYALLRPVQYKIAEHTCKLIQEKKLSKDDLLIMPNSVIERIQWLTEKKFLKLSVEQLTNIQKAYAASIIWSGLAQKNFEVNLEETMTVNMIDLKEVSTTINDFCRSSTIFKG